MVSLIRYDNVIKYAVYFFLKASLRVVLELYLSQFTSHYFIHFLLKKSLQSKKNKKNYLNFLNLMSQFHSVHNRYKEGTMPQNIWMSNSLELNNSSTDTPINWIVHDSKGTIGLKPKNKVPFSCWVYGEVRYLLCFLWLY